MGSNHSVKLQSYSARFDIYTKFAAYISFTLEVVELVS